MLAIRQNAASLVEFKASADVANRSSNAYAVTDGIIAGSPLIAIIDHRALGREVLVTALETAEGGFSSRAYADIGEWMVDENRHSTSAILVGIGGTSSEDPGLSADLRSLAGAYPEIPVLVMGDLENSSQVIEFLSHGVRGCIPTSASLSVAIGALSLAIAGGVFVPASALLDAGCRGQRPNQEPKGMLGLTQRQSAVAEGVARGKPNKVIAYELNLSESTIKVHIRGIMKKLQARNRTEVAFKLHAAKGRPTS